MKTFAFALVLAVLTSGCVASRGAGTTSAGDDIVAASRTIVASRAIRSQSLPVEGDAADVTTAHNDPARTGWNAAEPQLTTANVNARTFGKLVDLHVDGQVFAQPLVIRNVTLPSGVRRDLVIVATERATVYAFDSVSSAIVWRHTFAGCCGVSAVPAALLGRCAQISPLVGISSTPAIDRRTGTLYVVAKSVHVTPAGSTFHSTLYALDLATGADRVRPADITATVQLSARGAFSDGSSLSHSFKRVLRGGTLTFDAEAQFNRAGLLLSRDRVYVAFGSHCDITSAHGWIFAYDARTLARRGAFTTIGDWHDVNGGGIWQAGFGLTADATGRVYFTTGNGPFDADSGGRDYGDSLLALTPDLSHVADFYTPATQRELEENDADFGGGGMIALPDGPGAHPHLGIVSSKLRAIVLVDRDALGGYHPHGPDGTLQIIGNLHNESRWCIGTCGGAAYFASERGEYVFNVWALDALRSYRIDRHGVVPRLTETSHSAKIFPGNGGTTPSVSSNATRAGTAIVWATTRPNVRDLATVPIELTAFDAEDVSRELYRGAASFWHNHNGAPFLTPTIANGKVYVGGDGVVSIFGLLPHAAADTRE